MKNALLILLLINLTSCSRVILFAFGIKSPKVISEKKIEKKYSKYNLVSDYSLCITEAGFMEYAESDWSTNSLFIYTKSGKSIMPKDTNSCSGKVEKFIDVFKDTNFVKLVDTNASNYYNEHFVSLDGTPINLSFDTKYLAVVYWATYTGRLNKDLSAKWVESLNNDDEVTLVCVSLDPREFWTDFQGVKLKTTFETNR